MRGRGRRERAGGVGVPRRRRIAERLLRRAGGTPRRHGRPVQGPAQGTSPMIVRAAVASLLAMTSIAPRALLPLALAITAAALPAAAGAAGPGAPHPGSAGVGD